MPPQEKFISCTFSDGMLPSEYSVTVHLAGRDLSLFAPKSYVRVIDAVRGKGLLRVRLIDPDHNVVALPAEDSDLGKRYFEVPPGELRSA